MESFPIINTSDISDELKYIGTISPVLSFDLSPSASSNLILGNWDIAWAFANSVLEYSSMLMSCFSPSITVYLIPYFS